MRDQPRRLNSSSSRLQTRSSVQPVPISQLCAAGHSPAALCSRSQLRSSPVRRPVGQPVPALSDHIGPRCGNTPSCGGELTCAAPVTAGVFAGGPPTLTASMIAQSCGKYLAGLSPTVDKFGELGGKEGCENYLFQQKLYRSMPLCD